MRQSQNRAANCRVAPAGQAPRLARGTAQTVEPGYLSHRTKAAVRLGLALVLVSCGGEITAPPVTGPLASAVPDPDVIVVERTTDIAAHDGIAAVHRTSREVLNGQLRVTARGAGLLQADEPASVVDAAHLPRPPISLPAQHERALCRAWPRWTRSMSVSPLGTSAELTGSGDAPASTLTVVREGTTIATVERSWVRTSDSWRLQRQVVTSADGRFRDVVTYRHLTPDGRATTDALPVADCVASTLDAPGSVRESRSYYAPRGVPAAHQDALNPHAPSFMFNDCTGIEDGQPCFDKKLDVYKADAALVVASTAVAGACLVPQPIVPMTCTLAVAAYGAAVLNLKFAVMSLANCRAEQAERTGSSLLSRQQIGTAALAAAPEGSHSTARRAILTAPPRSDYGDCDGYGGSGGDGSGGGGTGGGTGSACSWQDWEISYDGGVTWEYWGTFWTCITG
jgi:hypothetical protein